MGTSRGTTLVETLTALFLLAVGGVYVLGLFLGLSRGTAQYRNRMDATTIAVDAINTSRDIINSKYKKRDEDFTTSNRICRQAVVDGRRCARWYDVTLEARFTTTKGLARGMLTATVSWSEPGGPRQLVVQRVTSFF